MMKLLFKRFLTKLNVIWIYYEIKDLFSMFFNFNEKIVKNNRLAFFRQFLKKGDLVFDIGANWGNRTIVFSKLNLRVIAVEPQEQCAEYLRNRFRRNIIVEEVGVSNKDGIELLYINPSDTLSSFSNDWINTVKKTRFSAQNWNYSKSIKMKTLDTLIKEYGIPSFCKIDVEGYELNVLKGLSCPIPRISFEYTLPEGENNLNNCLYTLNSISEYKFNFVKGENTSFELDKWYDFNSFKNKFEKNPKDFSSWGDIYAFTPNTLPNS